MSKLLNLLPLLLLPLMVFLASCKNQTSKVVNTEAVKLTKNPDWAKDAVIYEVNTRQFTEEGTFNAFAQHLPRLKELGGYGCHRKPNGSRFAPKPVGKRTLTGEPQSLWPKL